MVVDRLESWSRCAVLPRLRAAFELLISPAARQWPDGRVELDGDRIIAMPQEYRTKPLTEGRWEAHRRYIDIQFILSGREAMGWAPLSKLLPITPFDGAKDVGFFEGQGDLITVEQGMFAIFYPEDGHMPCLQAMETADQVRKIVVKVLVA